MSEEAEIWREVREEGKAKRAKNEENSLKILNEHGVAYECLSADSRHYRVGDHDFWPSTGKYLNRKTKRYGRGVFNLLKELKK